MRRAAARLSGAVAAAVAAGAAAGAEPCDAAMGARACFEAPTGRYAHGVLGDALEWGALVLTLADGRRLRVELPEDRVFEDLAPRIVDVGGDGAPEVAVVEASATAGARLSVWGEHRGGLVAIAATPDIGTRFRWLAPAAWRDLDGDGVLDFAYVDRPHIGGVLRVWTFAAGGLTEVASAPGFSNHRIGDAFIASAVRDCGAGPEIVLPDFGWSGLRGVRLAPGGRLEVRDLPGEASAAGVAAAAAC